MPVADGANTPSTGTETGNAARALPTALHAFDQARPNIVVRTGVEGRVLIGGSGAMGVNTMGNGAATGNARASTGVGYSEIMAWRITGESSLRKKKKEVSLGFFFLKNRSSRYA
jgi:hypothetical protein